MRKEGGDRIRREGGVGTTKSVYMKFVHIKKFKNKKIHSHTNKE